MIRLIYFLIYVATVVSVATGYITSDMISCYMILGMALFSTIHASRLEAFDKAVTICNITFGIGITLLIGHFLQHYWHHYENTWLYGTVMYFAYMILILAFCEGLGRLLGSWTLHNTGGNVLEFMLWYPLLLIAGSILCVFAYLVYQLLSSF